MNEDKLIKILYPSPLKEDLNMQLMALCDAFEAQFVSTKEEDEQVTVSFDVEEEYQVDFVESSTFIINRFFGMTALEEDELEDNLKFGPHEAIYHHVEFGDEESAIRFGTWIKSCFSVYLSNEMYDVVILKPLVELDSKNGWTVLYGFPMESIVSGIDLGDDDSDDDFVGTFPVGLFEKKKEELN